MREPIKNRLLSFVDKYQIRGKILEIGAYSLPQSAVDLFPEPNFEYYNLDIQAGDVPKTIIADITDCKNVADESFDFVFSTDTFEHINRPWLAAEEIFRILKKGGYVFVSTVWSWRHHPCPIDYWRFSPDCLKFLFNGLQCLESDFDLSQRRDDIRGFWENKLDYVPIDDLGGWRENWGVFYFGRKL